MAVVGGLLAFAAVGCSGSSAGVGDGTSNSSGGSGSSNSPGSTGTSGSPGTSGSTGLPASAAEALFQAPTGSATPDSIYGLWGGSSQNNGVTFDSRMRLSASTATLATRCSLANGKTSGVVGVSAAARITDESVAILESKSAKEDDGAVRCSVTLTPRELKRCSADVQEGFEQSCFKLEGMSFTSYGTSLLEKFELTKLSD